jgi:glycerate dehydrogenase
MKFNKICVVDIEDLKKRSLTELNLYSEKKPVFINKLPDTPELLTNAIGNTDCLLVGVSVNLSEQVFRKCKNLRYVGVYARALSRIDLNAAKENNVDVTNIVKWCDWETAEFVIASILDVFRAIGDNYAEFRIMLSCISA